MEFTTNDDAPALSSSDITDAFAGADFGQDDTPDETQAPTPVDEESTAEDDDEDAEEEDHETTGPAEGDKPFNPEGPGNVKAALKQARDEAKALKEQHQLTLTRLQALENERARERADLHARQQRAEREQILSEMHPDDVPAYLEAERQRESQQLQHETQQKLAWQRLSDSAAAARAALGEDFDKQLTKLTSVFGNDLVNYWAMGQEAPALAVYNAAKGLFTQADIDAAKEEGRKAALEGLPNRANRKQPSAPRLGNLPPAGRTTDATQADRLEKRLAKGGDVSDVVSGLFAEAFRG